MQSIDLHDLTVAEAIEEFVRRYNGAFAEGNRDRIEIIHGYGSSGVGGAIRLKLRRFLDANADRFRKITPGEAFGNPGVTYVDPKGRLPQSSESSGNRSALTQAILAFCATPKSEKKILTKLIGRFGDPAIRAEIRELARIGALEEIRTGAETKFAAS